MMGQLTELECHREGLQLFKQIDQEGTVLQLPYFI